MQFLGINEYSTLPVKKYSLGMKQKLIVTMYLVSGAKYFLMDEITNGLDEESRLILYNRLEKEVIEKKKCIILTSHYSSEINVKNLHRLVFQNKLMREV